MQEPNETRKNLINDFSQNYMAKIFYFCLRKTGNNFEAEDLTQDIALQVISALNKGTIPTSFSAWVWQIARNRYSVWAKAKHVGNESVCAADISEYEIEDKRENILDEMINTEQTALLRRELAFIKSDYRNIVVAYYIENKSVREISSALSLPINTVKSRLFRARDILKEGIDMAREFGKRSYDPEEITYTNVCIRPGELGQPWTLMDPKLNQNIFLACYDKPLTSEELAIEVGVALPYIEDTVNRLTAQKLLVKNGDRFETNFPIISREAQEKIHFFYEGIMPRLISLVTENIDILMGQYEEAGLCYYGEYQNYEDAKWALLPNFYKGCYALSESSPRIKLGNTKRENNGIWDVVAFERCDLTPDVVGYHCQSNGFAHYRFGYEGMMNKTPANLTSDETYELALMASNKKASNASVAEKLVKYGYAYKEKGKYVPKVCVISKGVCDDFMVFCKNKNHSKAYIDSAQRQKEIHGNLMELFCAMNQTVRGILNEDLPECVRENAITVDALLESVCTTSHTLGYIVKHALASGWLKYNEENASAFGAYLNTP